MSCTLLAHEIFLEQYFEFVARYPDVAEILNDHLRISKEAPSSGSPIQGVTPEQLQGRLRKIWIGGRTGFRYVYFYDEKKDIVLPIFLSLERRKDFDWRNLGPIEDRGMEIASDYAEGKTDRFQQINVIVASKS